MTSVRAAGVNQAAILRRVIQPKNHDLSRPAAKALLQFEFGEQDRTRMHELAEMNRLGILTKQDQVELEDYMQVGMVLDLLQAKARGSLKRSSARG